MTEEQIFQQGNTLILGTERAGTWRIVSKVLRTDISGLLFGRLMGSLASVMLEAAWSLESNVGIRTGTLL